MTPLTSSRITGKILRLGALLLLGALTARADWWDSQWPLRKPLVLDAAAGVALDAPTGPTPLLVRLHGGNFQFAAAAPDGRDLRVVAADGKTLLPVQVESFDALLNEGFAWVLVPDLKPGQPVALSLYYGNPAAAPAQTGPAYDEATLIAYHFNGSGAPVDSSGKGHDAANAGVASPASMIGPGLRLVGGAPVVIPASEGLRRAAGAPLTWSAWVKPAAVEKRAVIFQWGDANDALRIGLDGAAPFAEVVNAGALVRASAEDAPVSANWFHLAVVAGPDALTLYVDGKQVARREVALPALAIEARIGADLENTDGFDGEIDEMLVSGVARSAGWVRFAAVSQSGSAESLQLVALGDDEGGEAGGHGFATETLQHVFLFGDIAKNMMFDGWIAVGICIIMMIVGWIVALRKFAYLKRVEQGSEEFLRQWKQVSTDLTVLDHSDAENVKTLGGNVGDKRLQELMQTSPLYHLYHIGSEEIRHRLHSKRGFNGLSSRSITAIKASLDAGYTREVHRLNSGLVSLTIGIAGGPYVGLMGTVVGVMITFAVIAKTGEVEVNSIAPGIASALLATVFGLLVAIPALFLYSFLNSRIKEALSNMQLFIDEFITKMAEFYPTTGAARTSAETSD